MDVSKSALDQFGGLLACTIYIYILGGVGKIISFSSEMICDLLLWFFLCCFFVFYTVATCSGT